MYTYCKLLNCVNVCLLAQFSTQPIPVETTTDSETTTTNSTLSNENEPSTHSPSRVMMSTVAVAVGVSVGVTLIAVIMLIGLVNGFRYLIKETKGDNCMCTNNMLTAQTFIHNINLLMSCITNNIYIFIHDNIILAFEKQFPSLKRNSRDQDIEKMELRHTEYRS